MPASRHKQCMGSETPPVLYSSSLMYVAWRTSRPSTEARRLRRAAARELRSMRTSITASEEFIRMFALDVSEHSVSKYASTCSCRPRGTSKCHQ